MTGVGKSDAAQVAILLRTRDRPMLVARALNSILAQRHQDWHLVLVDGGTDQERLDALLEIHASSLDNRISVLRLPGSAGPDVALQQALEQPFARNAAFLAIHDDDDAWHPDFLGASLSVLNADPILMASACHGWRITERMDDTGPTETAREPAATPSGRLLDLAEVLRGADVPPISLLMRRTAVPDGAADARDVVAGVLLQGDVAVLPRRLCFSYRRLGRAGPYRNRSTPDDADRTAALVGERNAALRALAKRAPELPILLPLLNEASNDALAERLERRLLPELHTIRDRLDRNAGWGHGRHQDLQERLVRIESDLAQLRRLLGSWTGTLGAVATALRPLRALWRLLERPRRLLARLRGRI